MTCFLKTSVSAPPLGWLDEAETVEATGVSHDLLRRGIAAGLFDGLARQVEDVFWFAPDVLPLLAWSDKLGDDVIAGRLDYAQAHRWLWARARQLRKRAKTLDRQLAAVFVAP